MLNATITATQTDSLDTNPHAQLCCNFHGCRFNNDELCPVSKGTVSQLNKCGESAICSEYRASVIVEHDDHPAS